MARLRTALVGNPDALQVDRARIELRSGRPVRVRAEGASRIVAAIDTLQPALLAALAALPDPGLRVATTRERGAALGLEVGADCAAPVEASVALAELRAFAGADAAPPAPAEGGSAVEAPGASTASAGSSPLTDAPHGAAPAGLRLDAVLPATALERAAVELAKHALLLPSVLSARDDEVAGAHLLVVDAEAIAVYEDADALQLERLAEAAVPLADAPRCRMVVFRDRRDGTEHVAILVGSVDPGQAVEVRVHSACLTGDLFGSLRCDCGDQLRGAVRRFAALGGGVLLYVGQEGRGIGLANKLRAYRLQEAGLDTIDADRHLGFAGDERRFEIAAALLAELGIARVRLHTNNPRKAGALSALGIDVIGFRTLAGAVNPHNEKYIRVRRERAGHVAPGSQ